MNTIKVSTSIPAFIPRKRPQLAPSALATSTGVSLHTDLVPVAASSKSLAKPFKKSSSSLAKKARPPTKHKPKGLTKMVHKRDQLDTGAILKDDPDQSQPKKRTGHNPAHSTSTKTRNPRLDSFHKTYLGLEPEAIVTNNKGELPHTAPTTTPINSCAHADPISNFYHPPTTAIYQHIGPKLEWQHNLPSASFLYKNGFGKPDLDHSFTQEACGETTLHFVLQSGYLTSEDKQSLYKTNPLLQHLDSMRQQLSNYDFTWIRNINECWEQQESIQVERSRAMLACLFHFNMDVSLLMRYLGNNYTAAHRNTTNIVEKIRPHVDEYLLEHYIRVMTVGSPNTFNVETTRDNALRYWRGGNNPSIKRKLGPVMKTMNKEERNNFVIPLPLWLWRFIPHLFFTPQHILEKLNKKDRQIFDAAYRHCPECIPINMMTPDAKKTELRCEFGDVKLRVLIRIWNLRITYPKLDIALHANDVKSCFRQLKHHPDVMGAFSYILGEYLFLQCALAFGSDFSPASWEVVRRIAEQLAEKLFDDDTLRAKHRKYLDKLVWHPSLGNKKAHFSPAKKDSINKGVMDEQGNPVKTPHAFYVDDDIYAEVYNIERIERAIAASIEAIFILLGESDLLGRQDPISFDKLTETMVSFNNIILGQVIHTRTMMLESPPEYIQETVKLLQRKWHRGRPTFMINDLEALAGRLGFISETAPWLRFMMAHLYTSVAAALKISVSHLLETSWDFRMMMKFLKGRAYELQHANTNDCDSPHNSQDIPHVSANSFQQSKTNREITFAQSITAKAIHRSRLPIEFNTTLRHELRLIERALRDPTIKKRRPISHAIPRDPSGTGWSDSSLLAAGGYSVDMQFWWYIEWPEEVQRHTLRYIKNNKDGNLISINVLEYAGVIINYIASTYFFRECKNDPSDPYPTVLLYADNTTAEAWAIKACKKSLIGRSLALLQCALMMDNHVGIHVDHITTKDNEIADRISRIDHETNSNTYFASIVQDFPQLKSCRRFHPSPELVSSVMEVLLRKKSFDPLAARDNILSNLGRSTI